MSPDDPKRPVVDWVNLPQGIEPVSLWVSLHDGILVGVHTDPLERTARLSFEVGHLENENEKDLKFIISFVAVKSVRAIKWNFWPGEFLNVPNLSREEHSKLVEEYHAKGRYDSVSWSEFEATVKEDTLDIAHAEIVQSSGEASMFLTGMMAGEVPYEVWLRAEAIRFQRSDDKNWSLAQFLELGESYWENFGKGSR